MKKTIYIDGNAVAVDMTAEEMANLPKYTHCYELLVSELIASRYDNSYENKLSSDARKCMLGLCSEEEKAKLMSEAKEFELFRQQCKETARKTIEQNG